MSEWQAFNGEFFARFPQFITPFFLVCVFLIDWHFLIKYVYTLNIYGGSLSLTKCQSHRDFRVHLLNFGWPATIAQFRHIAAY
jgi:hypothetical protein